MTRSRSRFFHLTASVALASVLASAVAWSQPSDADKSTARALGQEAVAALDKKDFTTALDRFTRADSLFHAPTLALGIAQSLVGLGRFVSANEAYNKLIREGAPAGSPPAFVEAVETAKKEQAALQPRIPSVVLTVEGAKDPVVTIDNEPVPAAALGVRRVVDPGKHVAKATAAGGLESEQSFELREGASTSVKLVLAPAAAHSAGPAQSAAPIASAAPTGPAHTSPPGQTQRIAGYSALGVGGAGLIVGTIAGVIALSKKSTLNDECPGNVCPADKKGDLDSFRTTRTVSTIGFVVGVVGAGAGVALLLTAPKAKSNSAFVSPFVGPGSLGVMGSF